MIAGQAQSELPMVTCLDILACACPHFESCVSFWEVKGLQYRSRTKRSRCTQRGTVHTILHTDFGTHHSPVISLASCTQTLRGQWVPRSSLNLSQAMLHIRDNVYISSAWARLFDPVLSSGEGAYMYGLNTTVAGLQKSLFESSHLLLIFQSPAVRSPWPRSSCSYSH